MLHDNDVSFCDHDEALAEAEASRARFKASLNRTFYPAFHICAPAAWINDPNGLCYSNGRYHAFYQHNPFDTVWGPMYWGHLTSPDLVHWTDEPIALAPSIEADREGVWSGSCVTGPDGRLYAFYTGHRWFTTPVQNTAHRERQCLAVSSDGTHFEKLGVVVDNPANLRNFRDPKVFNHDGIWYMVVGQESPDHKGQVVLFRSRDLTAWEAAGILYECPEENVYMLECPDIFPLGDAWVLVFSKMYVRPAGKRLWQNCAGYVVGNWQPGKPLEVLRDFRPLDGGHNYYAPQSFETPDGRRVGFGWVRPNSGGENPERTHGWCGQLTLPRECSLTDDLSLRQQPIAEVASLFGEPHHVGPFPASMSVGQVLAAPGEIALTTLTITIDAKGSSPDAELLLTLKNSEGDGALDLFWSKQIGRVGVDRGALGYRQTDMRSVAAAGDVVTIQLFLDRSLLEVYVNDGAGVMSELIYPSGGHLSAALSCASGTVSITDVTVADLKEDIWQDR